MKKGFSEQLKSADLKVTEGRKAVLDILSLNSKPITAEDIKQKLDNQQIGLDLATVYRILKMFSDKHIVKKVSLQEGKTHYESSSRPHHHHVVCLSCGKIVDVEECLMDDMEKDIEKETGFTIESHSFEMFGLCPTCQRI